MGLGKGFGIGLLILVVLNLAMNVLLVVAGGSDIGAWFGNITSDPLGWISGLFAFSYVFNNYATLLQGGILAGLMAIEMDQIFIGIVMMLGWLVPPLVASIIAGKLSEGVGKGFGAWMLICVVQTVVLVLLVILDGMVMPTPSLLLPAVFASFTAPNNLILIIFVVISTGLNGMIYGGVSALMGRED